MRGSTAQVAMQQVIVIGGVLMIAAAAMYILLGTAETGQEELGKGQELAYAEIKIQSRLSSGRVVTRPKDWLVEGANYRTKLNVTNPYEAQAIDIVEIPKDQVEGDVLKVVRFTDKGVEELAFTQDDENIYVHASLDPKQREELEIYTDTSGAGVGLYAEMFPLQGGGGCECVLSGDITMKYVGNISIKGDNGQATSGGESCNINQEGCNFSSEKLETVLMRGEQMQLKTSGDAVIVPEQSRLVSDPHTLYYYLPACTEDFTHEAEKELQDELEKDVYVFNNRAEIADVLNLKQGTTLSERTQSKKVSPSEDEKGNFWTVRLPANTSYSLQDVPNYLSCSAGAYFVPETKQLCGMQVDFLNPEEKADQTPPQITNIQYAPLDPAGLRPNTNDEIQIQAVATDDQNLSNCELTIDDTTQTYPMGTMTPDGKQENTYDSKSEIIWANILTHKHGNRTVTISCWDIYNNKGQSNITLPITQAPDHAGPQISDIKISPGSPKDTEKITVEAKANDPSKISSCRTTVKGIGSQQMTAKTGTYGESEEITLETILDVLAAGPTGSQKYLLEIYCNDTAGNHALENTTITVVDGKPPKTTTAVSPPEALIDNLPVDTPIVIQVNSNDETSSPKCSYAIDMDPDPGPASYSSPISSKCTPKDAKSTSCTDTINWYIEGEYKIKVECLDANKNTNTTEYIIHYIDSIAPTIDNFSISPQYPKSSSDPTPSTIIFTAQVTDNVEPDQCRIKIGTQSSEMQLTETKGNADSINSVTKKYQHSTTLPTGVQSISVSCNDTSSPKNLAKKDTTLSVYGPIAVKQAPKTTPTLLEHAKTSTAQVAFSLDAMDTDCQITFTQAAITQQTMNKNPSTGEYSQSIPLAGIMPGTYTAQISCADPSGHTHAFSHDLTIVDTTPPTVGSLAPTSTDEDQATKYSATATDNVAVTQCTLSTGIASKTMTISQGKTEITETINTPGVYTFKVNCSDAAGNSAESTTSITIRDITPPNIGQITPLSMNEDTPTTLSIPVTDNAQVAKCVFEDKTEPMTKTLSITSGTASGSYTPTSPGTHSVEITCEDPSGNTNTSSQTLTVLDITPPTVGKIQPSLPQVIDPGVATSFSVSVTDNVGVSTCSMIVDAVNTLSMTVSGQQATRVETFATAGTDHQVVVECSDAAGNTAQGPAATVRVKDQTPPIVLKVTPTNVDEDTQTQFTVPVTDNVGVTSCVFQVPGKSALPMTIMGGQKGAAGNAFVSAEIPNPGTSYVIVTCSDAAGNSNSTTTTLTVNDIPPAAPLLGMPTDGQTLSTFMPRFTWYHVDDATRYELTYGTHTISSSSTSYQSTVDLPNGAYQWKVRAVDDQGTVGAWSTGRSFTISVTISTHLHITDIQHDPGCVKKGESLTAQIKVDNPGYVYSCSYYVKDTAGNVKQSQTGLTGSLITSSFSIPDEGDYKKIANCQDTLGAAATLTQDFKVVTTQTFPAATIVIAMDTSGSMGGSRIQNAAAAATGLINKIRTRGSTSGDRIGYVRWSTSQSTRAIEGYNYDNVYAFASSHSTGGGTYMGSGVLKARQMLDGDSVNNRKAIVLLTDGQTYGGYSVTNACREAGQKGYAIFGISFGGGYSNIQSCVTNALNAGGSGSKSYSTYSGSALDGIFQSLYEAIPC